MLSAPSVARSMPRVGQRGETARRASVNARVGRAGRKLSDEELPREVGKGSWSKSAESAVERLRSGSSKDTETHYRQKDRAGKLGAYSAERVDLHNWIVHLLLQGSSTHERPEAHFLAGGPASGKSTLVKSGLTRHPKDAVVINPDVVKEMLPEYRALKASGDRQAAAKVHEESSHVAKLATNIAILRKHHVLIDTVGDSEPGKFASKVERVRDAGYAVHVHYATISTEEALARAKARERRSGRAVPEGYLRSAHAGVSREYRDRISKLPGAVVKVYDNTGKRPRLVSSKVASARTMRVLDERRHAAFVGKARG